MGGVSVGSPVSASNTNQAFIDANGDDTGVGKYTLANTDVVNSGAQINNLQAAVNSNSLTTGAVESDFAAGRDYTGAPASTIVSGANHKTALIALAVKFDPTDLGPGHNHDGTAGQGPKVNILDLKNIQLVGSVVTGTTLTGVTGSSWDVSTELTGATPSTAQTIKGVVVNAPYNYVTLFDSNDDSFLDASGNKVYGRLTESTGVWTLTFYSDIAGVQTSYSFVSSTSIKWIYQQLFDEADRPVYSELIVRSSDQVAGEIPDATTAVKGKVLLATATPQPVSSTAAVGTGPRVSMEDHAHVGLHSIAKSGSTALVGDVTLTGTNGNTLVQVAQNIEISGTPLSGSTPQPVAATGAAGSSTSASKADHVHAGVASLNAILGAVNLVAGSNITLSVGVPTAQDITITASSGSSATIATLWPWVVGSAAQVTAGQATHSTWAGAIAAASAGDSIRVLKGTWTENVSINKNLFIEGTGYGSNLTGSITFTSGSQHSYLNGVRASDNVTMDVGANLNQVTAIWLASGKTFIDNGTGNYLQGFTEA